MGGICVHAPLTYMHQPCGPARCTYNGVSYLAGDRFRECYYWDSYWVVRGLLASGMRATARHIVLNLLHLVNTYGHVPNGARTYYLNRR
jgi:alpha,alpha-trehalase